MPNSTGPVWSIRVIKDDGNIDLDVLHQQARRRREQTEAAFSLYRERRIPIGMLAKLVGTDPVSLRMDWPYKEFSLFVGIGSEDERQAGFTAIRKPGQRFVVDLFTVTELILQKTDDGVLQTSGRPLVPESQRQKLLEIMEDVPGGKQVATMRERNGLLQIVELSDSHQGRWANFLKSMLAFIDERCDVVATAGPEEQSKELRDLVQLLDNPSADCILLRLERDAALLTEDGGLRLLAAQVGVSMSSGLQPVWMEAVTKGHLRHTVYVDCLAAKLRGNHDFVSMTGRDLMELAARMPNKVHPAVRAGLETFRRPTLVFSSGVKVCADFLRLAVGKLPPSTTGQYAAMTVEVLAHGRNIPEKELKRAFATRLNIFGRNGRRLPPHVRCLFQGMLSRHYLRR